MIVVAVQMHYAKDSDLGFDKDAIVMKPMGVGTTGAAVKAFEGDAMKIAGVKSISACYEARSSRGAWNTGVRYNNRSEDEPFDINMKAADDQYVPLFGLQLVAGRNLAKSDTLREYLVNETFVRKLNIRNPQEIIGKTITCSGGMTAPIVGVVKDFHDGSFKSDIKP